MAELLQDIEVPLTIIVLTIGFLLFIFVWAKKGGIQDRLDQQALDEENKKDQR